MRQLFSKYGQVIEPNTLWRTCGEADARARKWLQIAEQLSPTCTLHLQQISPASDFLDAILDGCVDHPHFPFAQEAICKSAINAFGVVLHVHVGLLICDIFRCERSYLISPKLPESWARSQRNSPRKAGTEEQPEEDWTKTRWNWSRIKVPHTPRSHASPPVYDTVSLHCPIASSVPLSDHVY